MGTDAAAIIPDSMLIEFVEAGGKTGSTDLYERLARFCDEQMSKGVLGQTSSTDAMAGGLGSGQANLHGEVREDLLKADARLVSGTLTRDIGRPIVDLNMGPVDRYPKITVVVEDPEDLKELGENAERLHRMGLPIAEDFLYGKFNIPKPEAGQTVLPSSKQSGTPPATGENAQQLALNAQPAVNASEGAPLKPSDLIAERLASEGSGHMGAWISTIETMLAQAEDLDHFRTMLMAAYSQLDSAGMAGMLASAMMSSEAAGRFDIESSADAGE